MKNLRDPKTKIYPSTTRGGKELPSSSALDSPSLISRLATPKPASAINSEMLHVIDDSTSAMHDACYLLSMRWFSLEEERVMQQSSVSISLSF